MTRPVFKVDVELVVTRLDELILQADNVRSFGVGPQPDANRAMRRQFLAWLDSVEQALAWALDGSDVLVALQTPRTLSIVEDRVPDLELYRQVDAELRLKSDILRHLRGQARTTTVSDAPTSGEHAAADNLTNRPPKVFISHASEDKDRFVLDFARRLRQVGVEAWLDRWELQPGDSLVDRIFEEGIASADAFVIVLSNVSVDKKWVREELNAAVVRRLSDGTRLLPVVLDGVHVPQSLRATIWVQIADTTSYDREFDDLVRAIFGGNSRPSLGPPPAWVDQPLRVPGLTAADVTVLIAVVEGAVAQGHRIIAVRQLLKQVESDGISRETAIDSLLALGNAGYMDVMIRRPATVSNAKVTNRGLLAVLEATRPDLEDVNRRLIAELVNSSEAPGAIDGADLVASIGEPQLIVEVLLDGLASRDLVKVGKSIGNALRVHNVSPLLRREL